MKNDQPPSHADTTCPEDPAELRECQTYSIRCPLCAKMQAEKAAIYAKVAANAKKIHTPNIRCIGFDRPGEHRVLAEPNANNHYQVACSCGLWTDIF